MVVALALYLAAGPQAIGIMRDNSYEMLVKGSPDHHQVLYRFNNEESSWINWFDISTDERYLAVVTNRQGTLTFFDLAHDGRRVKTIQLGNGVLCMPRWRGDSFWYGSVSSTYSAKKGDGQDIRLFRTKPPNFVPESYSRTSSYLVASRSVLSTPKDIRIIGLPSPERKALGNYAELSGIRPMSGPVYLFPSLRKTVFLEISQSERNSPRTWEECRFYSYDWGARRANPLFSTCSVVRKIRRIGDDRLLFTLVPNANPDAKWPESHFVGATGSPFTDLIVGSASETYVSVIIDMKTGDITAIPGLVSAIPLRKSP